MWLEKFIFFGRSVGPSAKHQRLAEYLATGNSFPLGKHLLGSAYHLMHEVSIGLRKNESITNLGGPWWFLNLWLNLHMQRVLEVNIFTQQFPSDQPEGEDIKFRRCTSFGEAASSFNGDRLPSDRLASYFGCFYNGLNKTALVWFAYDDPNNSFEQPINFQFGSAVSNDNRNIFKEMIRPNLLPVTTRSHVTYEFYHPLVIARQLGFGQAPIKLYFGDLMKPRD